MNHSQTRIVADEGAKAECDDTQPSDYPTLPK